MSKTINKIRLGSWLYSGRKGSGSGAGREMRGGGWALFLSESGAKAGEEKSKDMKGGGVMRE